MCCSTHYFDFSLPEKIFIRMGILLLLKNRLNSIRGFFTHLLDSCLFSLAFVNKLLFVATHEFIYFSFFDSCTLFC